MPCEYLLVRVAQLCRRSLNWKSGMPAVVRGLKPLLYIYEAATSLNTRKDVFTGAPLLIEEFSHPGIHGYHPVELSLSFSHLNQASIEIQIKPFQVKDFSSTHAGMQSDRHNVPQLFIISHCLKRRCSSSSVK